MFGRSFSRPCRFHPNGRLPARLWFHPALLLLLPFLPEAALFFGPALLVRLSPLVGAPLFLCSTLFFGSTLRVRAALLVCPALLLDSAILLLLPASIFRLTLFVAMPLLFDTRGLNGLLLVNPALILVDASARRDRTLDRTIRLAAASGRRDR